MEMIENIPDIIKTGAIIIGFTVGIIILWLTFSSITAPGYFFKRKLKKMSRDEKAQYYIKLESEQQLRWGNIFDDNWDFINKWNDEQLDKNLIDVASQLRFEKGNSIFNIGVNVVVFLIVAIGLYNSKNGFDNIDKGLFIAGCIFLYFVYVLKKEINSLRKRISKLEKKMFTKSLNR